MRDNEVYGGYALPVTEHLEGYSEGGAAILAYSLVAASGFVIGLLATWIF